MIRKGIAHFVVALAAMASLATLVTFVFYCGLSLTWRLILSLFILISSVIYVFVQMWRKKRISITITPQLTINIFEGDIFETRSKESLIVIPVNEYFDTIVNNKIIAKNTLHGKFICNVFGNKLDELDNRIVNALYGVDKVKTNNDRKAGKKDKYPIGTCADIEIGGTLYVLVAFTHFDEKNQAYIKNNEIKDFICRLIKHVAQVANSRPIYMPLMGTGQSGMNISSQRLLIFYLDCIEFICPVSIPEDLNIVIKSLRETGISLNKIKDFCETINN